MMLAPAVWMIFGAMIGWLGSMLAQRARHVGAIQSTLIGAIGAALGGLLYHRGLDARALLDLGGLASAIAASMMLVLLVNAADGHGDAA